MLEYFHHKIDNLYIKCIIFFFLITESVNFSKFNHSSVTKRPIETEKEISTVLFISEETENNHSDSKNYTPTIIETFIEIVAPRPVKEKSYKEESTDTAILNTKFIATTSNTVELIFDNNTTKHNEKRNDNDCSGIREKKTADSNKDKQCNRSGEYVLQKESNTEMKDEKQNFEDNTVHRYSKRAGRFPRNRPKIWDQWGKWSDCSVTCGIGKLTRWRHCISGGCLLGEKRAQLKTCTLPAC